MTLFVTQYTDTDTILSVFSRIDAALVDVTSTRIRFGIPGDAASWLEFTGSGIMGSIPSQISAGVVDGTRAFSAGALVFELDFSPVPAVNLDLDSVLDQPTDYTAEQSRAGVSFDSEDFADTLRGSAFDDTLEGQGGDDWLFGDEGDDWLFGGPGRDTLDGGAGFDFASCARADAGVGARLDGVANFGDAAGDVYLNIEGLVGGDFDDALVGSNGANELRGGQGDDRLFGGGGNDTLLGGAGADDIDGGEGVDTARYADATAAVGARLDGAPSFGAATGDRFRSIEILEGSAFDDALVSGDGGNILRGGEGDDRLFGFGGRDQLFGEDGNDTLDGGLGADLIDGGDGIDTATYAAAAAAVGARLDAGENFGQAAGEILRNVEILRGSRFDDALVGGSGGNVVSGGAGDDRLFGLDGRDRLFGEAGNDTLDGGLGADLIDGGAGVDAASYASATAAVGARLDGGVNFGQAAGEIIRNVETLIGSRFGDALVGSNGGNILEGGAGDDRLFGLDGLDQLFGGAGNDTLEGGDGGDLLDGGDGVDTVSYASATERAVVRLEYGGYLGGSASIGLVNGGAARGDDYRNIENVLGSRFGDSIYGDCDANAIQGGPGPDKLRGGCGADRFVYSGAGFGNDIIEDFEDGIDLLDFSAYGLVRSIADLTVAEGEYYTRISAFDDSVFIVNSFEGVEISASDFIFA